MADEHKTDDENTQTQTNSGQENTSTQNTDGQQVQMSQADFDALISKKQGKASEKAKAELLSELGVENADDLKQLIADRKAQEEAQKTELEKLQEQLEAERAEKEKLANERAELAKKSKLNELAAKHGIKETDYFEVQLNKAQNSEDFNEDQFIESLKKDKPFVFGQTVKTDSSSNSNNQANTFADKVAGITSMEELKKLQQTL